MSSWFSQPQAQSQSQSINLPPTGQGRTEERKSFFDTVKLAVSQNNLTRSNTAPVPDPVGKNDNPNEEGSLLSKYSQKLKHSLSTSAIANKSKSFVQGTQESMQTSINLAKNLPYIIGLCAGGAFFFFISFMFLPMIVVFPHKFSFSFALGCMCFMGAIALLRDPKVFLLSLIKKDKILFSGGYVIALLGTFYFSLIGNSRILSLLFAFAQIVTLLWLLASSIPGGRKFMGTLQSLVMKCCTSLGKRLFSSGDGGSFLPM